jgi:hypothetical protein
MRTMMGTVANEVKILTFIFLPTKIVKKASQLSERKGTEIYLNLYQLNAEILLLFKIASISMAYPKEYMAISSERKIPEKPKDLFLYFRNVKSI